MALTNQQVQQVFLAITGRPAEGQAVTWGANSLSIAALANSVIDIRKGADFTNNKETFIENLYKNLLGRASDAEGKEFWLKVLNDGASYGDVVAQFINAVLVQNQTADLYTLENKLGIAEQISAQIPSFTGSEANLVQIMSNVTADTTIEDLSNDIEEFKGQNVNVANVSVNTKANNDTPTEGSEEHASVFNATVSILDNKINSNESSLLLNGSTNYEDTLNLTLKSSKNAKGKQDAVDLNNVLEKVSNIKVINLNVKDNNIAGVSGDIATDFDLKIEGTSKDKISVSKGKTVDTGAGDDTITVNGKATVIAGAGNDEIILGKDASGATISIDGGTGRDTVTLSGDNTTTKVTLTNVEVLKTSGTATVSETLLDGKSYNLASGADLKVSAANGIDLSRISMVTDVSGGKIAIDGVASGTVKLSAKDANIEETIKLAADAKGDKVQITNFTKGDVLNFKAAVNSIGYSGTGGGGSAIQNATSAGLVDAKAVILDLKDKNSEVIADVEGQSKESIIAALGGSNAGGKFTTANNKSAVVFVTNTDDSTDKTSIYLVKSGTADSSIASVALLATVDADAANTWTVDDSTLTFA